MLIDGLIDRMQAMLAPLQAADDPRQYFRATYLRTTVAARDRLQRGGRGRSLSARRWNCPHCGTSCSA
jgi:hypothetical protein